MVDAPEQAEPTVGERLAAVRWQVAAAARASGREPAAVTLVAVAKGQPDERIEAALAAGQRIFGENYVQEAQAHWQERRAAHPDLELHLIGPLQTNKVRQAVALFDVIQTVDRPRLAAALAQEIARSGRRPRLLVQVDTGDEPQKAGVPLDGLSALLDECREVHGLDIEGLMAIPPHDQDVAFHAALLADLAARHGLLSVSAGMSADFEPAIRSGATIVRVGSAIFGERQRREG